MIRLQDSVFGPVACACGHSLSGGRGAGRIRLPGALDDTTDGGRGGWRAGGRRLRVTWKPARGGIHTQICFNSEYKIKLTFVN